MFLKILCLNIFIFNLVVLKIEAANILAFFPMPSISHQVVFRPLTQELAKKGHQMTIITPDPAFKSEESPPNITEIDLHNESYALWKELISETVDGESRNSLDRLTIGMKTVVDMFEYQINTREVTNILKTKHFDLVLVEACVRPALVMSHIFKAPLIQVSSLGALIYNIDAIGAPSHPLIYPEIARQRVYNLSLWEKIDALRFDFIDGYRNIFLASEKYENSMLKKNFGPDTPTVAELQNNVDMLFLNIHPLWDSNRPMPPNVIHMGGLHQKLLKKLPDDLKTYLDSSKHGVIYMSFGTNVDPTLLPSEKIKIFCKVFSRLRYDVLWKWNGDELPGRPKNVRISKWLPQSDLLRHPKMKLFITQGGLQSTDEAITAGVPLIAFPMLGDQWFNAEKYVYHKIGLKMDLESLTEESLEESIKQVVRDPRYRDNLKRLGVLMRDQPQSPLERAVWWTEYVLRHGGAKHLRSPAANISLTEYLMLDVFVFLLVIFIIALVVLVTGIRYAWNIYNNIIVPKSKLKDV